MTDDQSPDDDDRLARLYRETDDDAEPPGEWSSLRAMIGAARADGFDEEPPARIDALLMAAARQHAPAPRPRWWQRLAAWMKPVMLHPVTAGALALVVVVGVAGVMYRRGDREVAQPPAPTIAPPVDQRSVTTAPPAVVTPPPEESERGAAVAPVAVAPPPPAPTPIAPRPSEPPAGPSPKRPPPADKPAATAGAGGGPTTMTTGALDEAAEADQLGVEGPAPDDGVAQVPPPPPVALPDRQATTAGDKGATVADLLRLARSAAAARDCEKVRVLSAQVLARDPAYHKAVFARDAAIAACLPAQLGY